MLVVFRRAGHDSELQGHAPGTGSSLGLPHVNGPRRNLVLPRPTSLTGQNQHASRLQKEFLHSFNFAVRELHHAG